MDSNQELKTHLILPRMFQPWNCRDLQRLGKDHDGGYLVSESDVKCSRHLVSLGIDGDWSFELAFYRHSRCKVACYDAALTIEQISAMNKDFDCDDLVAVAKNVSAHPKPNHVPLTTVIDKCYDVFLKCDIEGAEYDLLPTLLDYHEIWSGMVIEFHSIHEWHYHNALTSFLAKIPLHLVHLHVNNYTYQIAQEQAIPTTIEITLSRRAPVKFDPELSLPHALDQHNDPTSVDFTIDF